MRNALTVALLVAQSATSTEAQPTPLQQQVESLFSTMTAAFRADPASVARFYTDDARILGGGQRAEGRVQIDQYWRGAMMFADWTLEVLEVGGDGPAPWVRGRSTLRGRSGRVVVTEFVGLLRRQPKSGELKLYLDMFVAASPSRLPPSDG